MRPSESALIEPAIVEAMANPDFYPEHPDRIDLIQTHISTLFLAGDYVYKIKKPVRFPFLDASELAQRRQLCEDEIRLNRRLAPDVYLKVIPIVSQGNSFALGSSKQLDSAREYAVKMRRLDESRMLESLIERRSVPTGTIEALAGRLSHFHKRADKRFAWKYGRASAVLDRITRDLADYRDLVTYTVSEEDLAQIDAFCRGHIASHRLLMNRRAREGRVREGHGDLRACQINLAEKIRIFDCIEFSEKLRYCDVASDVGFLAMDLDRLGEARMSYDLVAAYAADARDLEMATMLPLYKCYRAAVRAMVESRESLDLGIDEAVRKKSREAARRYFALAHRYAVLSQPQVIAVCGLSGSGKSTVARAIRARLGFEVIASDTTRKELAGAAPTARTNAAYQSGIYAVEFSRKTYAAMVERAEAVLDEGRGVILDATWRASVSRAMLMEMVARKNAALTFIECFCDESQILRRLDARKRSRSDPSEADRTVYLRQRGEFEPFDEIPSKDRIAVDTSKDSVDTSLSAEERLFARHRPD